MPLRGAPRNDRARAKTQRVQGQSTCGKSLPVAGRNCVNVHYNPVCLVTGDM